MINKIFKEQKYLVACLLYELIINFAIFYSVPYTKTIFIISNLIILIFIVSTFIKLQIEHKKVLKKMRDAFIESKIVTPSECSSYKHRNRFINNLLIMVFIIVALATLGSIIYLQGQEISQDIYKIIGIKI